MLYAAFIGLLLASYASPIQAIIAGRQEVPELEARLEAVENDLAARERSVEELQTPEGIEREARESYGMIEPGERVYLIPEAETGSDE